MIKKLFYPVHIDFNKKALGFIIFLNNFSYVKLRNTGIFKNKNIAIHPDGIFLYYILKILGINSLRLSFDDSSLAPKVFSWAEGLNKNVYIIGGNEYENDMFIKKIKLRYCNLKVTGNHGYFENLDTYIDDINISNPSVVIVGVGTPKQEELLQKILINCKSVDTCFTCGAYISQSVNARSKRGDYYPNFIKKFELRWLYRAFKEKHVRKRIFFYYPLSLLLILRDIL